MVEKTGILTKQTSSIIDMITKTHKQWQKLFASRKSNTAFKQKERQNFIDKLQKIFWVPCPKYEKLLKHSTDSRLQEDQKFFEKLKKGEKAVIGSVDMKFLKRNKRKASTTTRTSQPLTAADGQDSLLSSSSAETDTDKDDEFTSPAMKRKELPKK